MNMLKRIGRWRRLWLWLCVGVAALSAAAFLVIRQRAQSGPRLLNEPTKAREAHPFSPEPDPRFAPLPIESEKHGK
jgi:hypothetical protein